MAGKCYRVEGAAWKDGHNANMNVLFRVDSPSHITLLGEGSSINGGAIRQPQGIPISAMNIKDFPYGYSPGGGGIALKCHQNKTDPPPFVNLDPNGCRCINVEAVAFDSMTDPTQMIAYVKDLCVPSWPVSNEGWTSTVPIAPTQCPQ